MDDTIYILSPGETDGPYQLNQIIADLESGKYKLDTYGYCKVVSKKWETLETILGFFYADIEWVDDEQMEGEAFKPMVPSDKETETLNVSPPSTPNKAEESLNARPKAVENLDAMLAHSKEFKDLTESLSSFNIWKVLNIRNREVYHEKSLKWMFDEKGSHGLGCSFLRNWLIEVLEGNQSSKNRIETNALGPINLDYAVFKSVVERQRSIEINGSIRRLDLLFLIETMKQGKWAILVELKVGNAISSTQLSSYRAWMDREFPDHKRLLILLFDDLLETNKPENWPEQKERNYWIPSTFSKLKNSIQETLKFCSSRVPYRETSFIEQYLENLPPLASNINLEQAEILTHRIFGNYSLGIEFAIKASDTVERERDNWQNEVFRFVGNYSDAFSLLSECTESKFLHIELTKRLEQSEWFPKLDNYLELLGEGIDCCDLFRDSEDWPGLNEEHLIVRLQLYYGTKDNVSCFRIRIWVDEAPTFLEVRENLIQDFFAQLHPFPPNYGGRDMVNRHRGLIYNLPLEYLNHYDLFKRVDGILFSFHAIWTSENFAAARKAILRHISI